MHTTQPGLSEIPQEIIDEVIDRCSADKETLKACSLTSRAWVYRTRKHLFATLKLTDKTLVAWCWVIVAPLPQPDRPLTSSPYASSWLPSCVTSLDLSSSYSRSSGIFEDALLRANTHLSAFINLKTLTLSAVSLTTFSEASLTTSFGSLGKTVRKLELWKCSLGSRLFTFLKLFIHLESLELDWNAWSYNNLPEPPRVSPEDLPTLRGSLTISHVTKEDDGLVNFLATARVECHAITIGCGTTSAFSPFGALFAKCGDHLRTLTLTVVPPMSFNATPQSDSAFDLSPCKELVELHAQLKHSWFGFITRTLGTISSRRFRKLTLVTPGSIPDTNPNYWVELDTAIVELAKRVDATAGNDVLQVLIGRRPTVDGTQLSKIKVLPLTSSDARVSLRA